MTDRSAAPACMPLQMAGDCREVAAGIPEGEGHDLHQDRADRGAPAVARPGRQLGQAFNKCFGRDQVHDVGTAHCLAKC